MRLQELNEREGDESGFKIIRNIAKLFDEAKWDEVKGDQVVKILKQHGYSVGTSMRGLALHSLLHGKPHSYLNNLRDTIEEIVR